jgi:hypothetical protein
MSSNLQRSPQPRTTPKPKGHAIRVSPILTELARLEKSEVFARLKTFPRTASLRVKLKNVWLNTAPTSSPVKSSTAGFGGCSPLPAIYLFCC